MLMLNQGCEEALAQSPSSFADQDAILIRRPLQFVEDDAADVDDLDEVSSNL